MLERPGSGQTWSQKRTRTVDWCGHGYASLLADSLVNFCQQPAWPSLMEQNLTKHQPHGVCVRVREVNASPGPRRGQGAVTMLVGQLTAARTATKKGRRHARAARLSEVAAPAISLAFSRLLSPSCVPPLSCTEREKKLCENPSLFLPSLATCSGTRNEGQGGWVYSQCTFLIGEGKPAPPPHLTPPHTL